MESVKKLPIFKEQRKQSQERNGTLCTQTKRRVARRVVHQAEDVVQRNTSYQCIQVIRVVVVRQSQTFPQFARMLSQMCGYAVFEHDGGISHGFHVRTARPRNENEPIVLHSIALHGSKKNGSTPTVFQVRKHFVNFDAKQSHRT